ncbi:Gfo/Idh/MocA family oxidoreductase [Kribbella turkmenica]|uniref:Gfo/Idh/MocA family oxidoreductase n=1 Tax=Kribbella turkmenica TaxID=2530375 RepID=A0A4R4WUX2_9ACTN|nr:Gfo/Idh/MocA family oxidoreductase [Kribbella turkmenica]TDD21466.1 Gfo/Idh/MocA family oxidoreductase [Kribbella turkmenica]
MTPRVAVAGVHGHGASHVRNVARLAEAGRARLAAVADPRPAEHLPAGVRQYGGLEELLAAAEADVVIISTPIQTHVPLAELAMRAGADVLLEKPPTASLAEFEQLSALVDETGRACQVGFQAQASTATLKLAQMVADGRFGELRGISTIGKWVRKAQYFQRARWAGRRTLDGVAVVDGAVTNPLAHSTAAALLLDGSTGVDDVRSVETELFRANAIESDDTSTVRVVTGRGTKILVAVTLCATEHLEPEVIVHGSAGRAVLKYASDTLELPDGTVEKHGRADLLENLIAHRADPAVPLYCPLSATGGFTTVVEAVRAAADPAEIPAGLVRWEGEGLERHPIVHDVETWIDRASDELALFGELGAPWTVRPQREK